MEFPWFIFDVYFCLKMFDVAEVISVFSMYVYSLEG